MTVVGDAYRRAGVDIDAGNVAVSLMRSAVSSTHGPGVLSTTGSFGGAFRFGDGAVLVASTDSVGTKLRLSSRLGRHADVGVDLVNHCINDILTVGARPLFFLDYFATSALDPEHVAQVVTGVAAACRDAGCALLGGETAELPGMYMPGEYDVAGFIVGSVSEHEMLGPHRVEARDVLLGLPSSGPHTNGFSLINRLLGDRASAFVSDKELERTDPGLGGSLADLLLAPHRSYLPTVAPLLESEALHAIAHITGGGLIENLPRCLPPHLSASVQLNSWTPPPVFGWVQRKGQVTLDEMYRVFNMGVGMVLVVPSTDARRVLDSIDGAWELGTVCAGDGSVELVGLA
ncbi:MAG: phosphoribosylformylglycinamidine cyclo-ligase [Chloroflexota bacterium]|nr:phosphoribosylformylglycinamidine cyclo-ligase [Chloroflexota bacterium]